MATHTYITHSAYIILTSLLKLKPIPKPVQLCDALSEEVLMSVLVLCRCCVSVSVRVSAGISVGVSVGVSVVYREAAACEKLTMESCD